MQVGPYLPFNILTPCLHFRIQMWCEKPAYFAYTFIPRLLQKTVKTIYRSNEIIFDWRIGETEIYVILIFMQQVRKSRTLADKMSKNSWTNYTTPKSRCADWFDTTRHSCSLKRKKIETIKKLQQNPYKVQWQKKLN